MKEVKRFAFFPKKVTSGKQVWFSFYYETFHSFDPATGRPPLNSQYYSFTETEKEYKWRKIKDLMVEKRNVWNEPKLTQQDRP